jgi:hypothetical protein
VLTDRWTAGVLRGLATLQQSVTNVPGGFAIPAMVIEDAPRFVRRGVAVSPPAIRRKHAGRCRMSVSGGTLQEYLSRKLPRALNQSLVPTASLLVLLRPEFGMAFPVVAPEVTPVPLEPDRPPSDCALWLFAAAFGDPAGAEVCGVG